MSPCDRAQLTSYWRSIVTMALSRVVSEIFNVEKCRNLEIRVEGLSRSLKVVPFDWVWFPISVLQLYFVHKTQRFWDIQLQKCCDGENRVRGPSMLLPFLSPFDRAYTTSYWRSVVTMALSRDVSEIFNVEKCRDLEIRVRGHSRSSKVVPFDRLCMVSY